ncbi:MAG TPA: ATP-grasp domain-containing protein [Ktedonobacteraceae bacterium]|nr:ATP-grasp domain-containing protein [Ktedonobacteraceae bacterium]
MHFCFIIEAQYKHQLMPMAVAQQLMDWGHNVDLLEPETTITSLTRFTQVRYDAYVLKTVSDGPGLSILEAVEAIGFPTINNSRAIRLVRNKAVTAVYAHNHGLPTPLTYFVAQPQLLKQIPIEDYPLVVKPTNGSSCRGIYRVDSPADLETLNMVEANAHFFLAQQYIENNGFDIKLYVVGTEVFAVAKRSPLHPEVEVKKRLIPVTTELRNLALNVGKIFKLDIYGLDVVETPRGPIIVDINDFPSFGQVPHAISLVSSHIEHIATNRVEQPVSSKTDRLTDTVQELSVNIL